MLIPIKQLIIESMTGPTVASSQYNQMSHQKDESNGTLQEAKIKERNSNAPKINTSWNGSKQNGGRPQVNPIITEKIKADLKSKLNQ